MGAWKSRDGAVCDIFARACCAVDGHGELELDVDVGGDGGCECAGAFSMVFFVSGFGDSTADESLLCDYRLER